MDSPVDKLIHHMLFANYLQSKSLLPLFEFNDDDNFGYRLELEMTQSNLVFAVPNNSMAFHLCSSEEAKETLFDNYPILNFLSFQNYRLVGGACVNALRGSKDASCDLDFFPLVGKIQDTIQKESKANQIFESFIYEIQNFHETNKEDGSLQISYIRNEDCTTIFIRCDYGAMLKIQFVHRAFETEQQMVESADLFPSQILFDGTRFLCTYGALLSFRSNIIPIDISRNSASFVHRIFKYFQCKKFIIAFPGLDKNEVKANFIGGKFLTPSGFSLKERYGFFSMSLNVINVEKSYYADSPHTNSVRLASFNLLCHLNDKPVCLFAHSAKEFLSFPKKTKVAKSFGKVIHLSKEISRSTFKLFFGPLARDAMVAHFDEDEEKYSELIRERTEILEQEMREKFEALQKIKWKMTNPGMQKGSLLLAKDFYGYNYNEFRLLINTPIRIAILALKRFRSTMLSRIPKDVLFLILNQLELSTFREEELALHQSIQPRRGLPVPDFEDHQNRDAGFDEWESDDL